MFKPHTSAQTQQSFGFTVQTTCQFYSLPHKPLYFYRGNKKLKFNESVIKNAICDNCVRVNITAQWRICGYRPSSG